MDNVMSKVKNLEVQQLPDGRIAIVIDPSKEFGPSSTGRSTIVATAGGSLDIGHGVTVSITAYRTIPKAKRS